jgi:uncharacterized protein (TIGR03435 family)
MAANEGPPRAQSAAGKAPAVQRPTPQWQIDAGGKMEFDVSSVKQNTAPQTAQTVHANVPLTSQDDFAPTGGLLSAANWQLFAYMRFAYKLTPAQDRAVIAQLPKWANDNRYDIQARASGNPTKDQFRLMVQGLLADRFKLAVHYERQQLPVFAMVLEKPGKLGPKLRPHPADSPCSVAPPPPGSAPGPAPTVAGGYPEMCGAMAGMMPSAPGRFRLGARNVPMGFLADNLFQRQLMGVERPVVDKTGLAGKFDFVIEFTPQLPPLPAGSTFQPDPNGPTFDQALKEQLGLKLEPQTGPTDVIVIDHVEQPSEN